MKNLKFILCSLLMLSFVFSVKANENHFDKVKTEFTKILKAPDVGQSVVIVLTANVFTKENPILIVANSKNSPPPFAIMPNVSWSSNLLLNNYSIYKEKLNSNYVIDKRKQLKMSGNQYNCLDC